jgi:hypothetical protein
MRHSRDQVESNISLLFEAGERAKKDFVSDRESDAGPGNEWLTKSLAASMDGLARFQCYRQYLMSVVSADPHNDSYEVFKMDEPGSEEKADSMRTQRDGSAMVSSS